MWPIYFQELLDFSVAFSTLIFLGQLGLNELTGAALGNTVSYMIGQGAGYGMTTAVDTLCSQAYGAD